MKKIALAVCAVFGLLGCAADVMMSAGTAAETKKQELEQAEKTKAEVKEKLDEQLKIIDEQHQQMEEASEP